MSDDILSMHKRFSSILHFSYFCLCWKPENCETYKIWKISKCLKNLKIFNIFVIWKSPIFWKKNIEHFGKKISKSQNMKSFDKFETKISTSKEKKSKIQLFFPLRKIFLVEISRTNCFDHSFMSKSHVCDFCITPCLMNV